MDVAYDHIQEETLPSEDEIEEGKVKGVGLNEEFQEAFKAVSSSPWGARLGGLFGQLKTQGETLYNEATKEYNHASEQASKGLSDLRNNLTERARNITLPTAEGGPAAGQDPTLVVPEGSADKGKAPATGEKPESLSSDIVKEATSMVNRFKLEAASRLVAVRKAEDAADEALLRFGTNISNFLREAVTVSGPGTDNDKGESEVLFETNDSEGRRVFHSSRFDAQLHAIHSRPESFTKDPEGAEWDKWVADFDASKETDRIAADLDKHEELRRAMEKLVPEKVEYKDFWRRYYYLRMIVEEEEHRRKEILKGAAADNEEVGWGDDDEEEDEESSTPVSAAKTSQSTTTLVPTVVEPAAAAPRRSHDEKSTSADSDASYDLVSGANSKTPGTPLKKEESDDEEDWE